MAWAPTELMMWMARVRTKTMRRSDGIVMAMLLHAEEESQML
jgi:hypothetical protein